MLINKKNTQENSTTIKENILFAHKAIQVV